MKESSPVRVPAARKGRLLQGGFPEHSRVGGDISCWDSEECRVCASHCVLVLLFLFLFDCSILHSNEGFSHVAQERDMNHDITFSFFVIAIIVVFDEPNPEAAKDNRYTTMITKG